MNNKQNKAMIVSCRNSQLANSALSSHPELFELSNKVLDIEKSYSGFDLEDGVEDIIRLYSAIHAIGEENVWIMSLSFSTVTNISSGVKSSINELMEEYELFHVGGIPIDCMSPFVFENPVKNDYWNSQVIRNHMGRKTHIFDNVDPYNDESNVEHLFDFINKEFSHKNIVMKVIGKGKLPLFFSGSTHNFESDVINWLANVTGHSSVDILIQEKVNLGYEMRCFVKQGKVITSAGAVESHTPLNSINSSFHNNLFEEKRNDGNIIIIDKAQHKIMIDFANEVAEKLEKEDYLDSYITLDIGWNIDSNKPLVIETNPVSSSGLYGTSVIKTKYLSDLYSYRIKNSDNKIMKISEFYKLPVKKEKP